MTTLDINLCYKVWNFAKCLVIIDCVVLRQTILGRQRNFLNIFNFRCIMGYEVTCFGRLSSRIICMLERRALFVLMMRLGKTIVFTGIKIDIIKQVF